MARSRRPKPRKLRNPMIIKIVNNYIERCSLHSPKADSFRVHRRDCAGRVNDPSLVRVQVRPRGRQSVQHAQHGGMFGLPVPRESRTWAALTATPSASKKNNTYGACASLQTKAHGAARSVPTGGLRTVTLGTSAFTCEQYRRSPPPG